MAGTPRRHQLPPLGKWESDLGPSSLWFTCPPWNAFPFPSPASCPSTLLSGSHPRPWSFLFSFSWEIPAALVLPSWNRESATFIVSVFGARDTSEQLDCIPSKARPQSHVPQRSQHLRGPTQGWFTLIFMMRGSRGALCAAPGLNC